MQETKGHVHLKHTRVRPINLSGMRPPLQTGSTEWHPQSIIKMKIATNHDYTDIAVISIVSSHHLTAVKAEQGLS